ncbi:MFS transporter [Desulfofalx alkaliphila]|uniref:MFS transporter n=1 Tax=Desulfofalx alkaliphila TaxID=105483 RepID=UPI0004E1B7DB|nr:MFS transporter [Desulfofalx alkaliphila]
MDTKPVAKSALWTRDFILICLVNLTLFLGFQMLMPTLPVFVAHLGGQESMVGLVVGIFTVAAVVVRPFVGRSLDTHGRKPLLFAGLVVFIIITLAYNWAGSILMLLVLRFLHGLGWGTSNTATGTVASDIIPKPRLGEGMGYFGLATTLSMAVAPALGLYIIYQYNFTVLFFSSAALAILSLALSTCIKNEVKRDPKEAAPKGFASMFEPQAFRPSLVLFFITLTYGAVVTFIALHAAEKGILNIGIFFTVYAVVLAVTRPLAGMLADRKGFDIVVIPGTLLIAVGMLILGIAEPLWMFLAAAVFYALGFGFAQPSLQAMTVYNLPPHRRGAANGTFFSAFDLGIGVGAVLWGVVSQLVGYGTMYMISAIPALLALLLYLMVGRQRKEE